VRRALALTAALTLAACDAGTENGPETYTVTFDQQGGSGGTESARAVMGQRLPDITVPTKEDRVFYGYWTKENGGGLCYTRLNGKNNRIWDIASDTTLYAMWKATALSTVAAPEADPPPGYVIAGTAVRFTSATAGARVYLTTSTGTEPTLDSNGDVVINSDKTILAFARKEGMADSAEVSFEYRIAAGYTIAYDGNGHTGGSAPENQTKIVGAPLTLRNNTGGLVRTDYTFAGWNTQADGAGTHYAAGYNLTGELSAADSVTVTLYAQWGRYIIMYHLDGGTNAPGNPAAYITENTPVTLLAPEKTGHIFGGWYDNPGLAGDAVTAIPAGSAGDKEFWAKWTANTNTLTYDYENATGNNSAVSAVVAYDSSYTLAVPTKTHYTFGGWWTGDNGTGTQLTDSAGASLAPWTETADITVHAKWTFITYTIAYSANGGSGTAPASQTKTYGTSLTLQAQGGITKANHTFGGWNTNSAGTGTNFTAGGQLSADLSESQGATVTLYAKWTLLPYSVSFNLNTTAATAMGRPAAQTIYSGGTVRKPDDPVYPGCVFGGWYKEASCANAWNFSSDTVTQTRTLYAKWTYHQVSLEGNVAGSSGPGYTYSNGVYTLGNGASVAFNGTSRGGDAQPKRIAVAADAKAYIYLNWTYFWWVEGGNPSCSFWSTSPIDLGARSEVLIVMNGENHMGAIGTVAGIHVPPTARLTITSSSGDGSLGGDRQCLIVDQGSGGHGAGGEGAAIGGNNGETAGTIIIKGGKVVATSYGGGAGIGGGKNGSGGTITISGGTVEAHESTGKQGKHGVVAMSAAIGGGWGGSGGTITISGGNVTATLLQHADIWEHFGAAIGGGYSGGGGTVRITGGTGSAAGRASANRAVGPGRYGSGGTFNGSAFPTGGSYTWGN
jgi:uncharacterized repeat protein (TIGR02543 family)